MKSMPDAHGDARRADLRAIYVCCLTSQSDFEKSLPFRLTMLVAAFVIGINVLAPPPAASPVPPAVRATV